MTSYDFVNGFNIDRGTDLHKKRNEKFGCSDTLKSNCQWNIKVNVHMTISPMFCDLTHLDRIVHPIFVEFTNFIIIITTKFISRYLS